MISRTLLLLAVVPALALADDPKPAEGKKAHVMLRWKATAGASSYQVQVSKDSAFKQVLVDVRVKEPQLKWEALPSTTWFWRVRSFDDEARASEWSSPHTIAAATGSAVPKSPADRAVLLCGEEPVKLEVEPTGGLTRYQVEYAADERFLEPKTVESTDGTFSISLPPGSWVWRARGVDTTGKVTEASEVRHLSVKLGVPRLKAAPDLPTGVTTVALEWTPVACAKAYEIDAVHEAGEQTTLHETSNRLSFKPALAGQYRWKVAAIDERGQVAPFSAEGAFAVRTAPPFTKGEQLGEVVGNGRQVTLRWLPGPGAASYLLEVSPTDGFRTFAHKGVVTGTEAELVLPPGTYFWRVTGRDARERLSFASDPRKVFVPEPPPPEPAKLLSPPADSLVPRAVNGALPIAFSLGKDTQSMELELDGVSLGRFDASPQQFLGVSSGMHTLRARGIAPWGTVSEWSPKRTFFFGAPASESIRVTLDPETVARDTTATLRIWLRDDKGRPVLGRIPKLRPRVGTFGEVTKSGDGFVATYHAPRLLPDDKVDPIIVSDLDRDVLLAVPLSNGYQAWSFAVFAGGAMGVTNSDRVASPTLTVEGSYRFPFTMGQLEVALRLGFYFGPGRLGDLEVLPITALVGYHRDFGDWSVRAMVGGGVEAAAYQADGTYMLAGTPAVEGLVSGGLKLGPGHLELELGVLGADLRAGTRIHGAVFGLALGYRLGFGKGELSR